jgi:hypothetical protein
MKVSDLDIDDKINALGESSRVLFDQLFKQNKEIEDLQEKVDFLLKVSCFTTGYLENVDSRFVHHFKDSMIKDGYLDFEKNGDESE